MKVLVVVPAFNEEQSIPEVIADLRQHGFKNIVVVDDGSSDRTGEKARKAGAEVVTHLSNRGLGAALSTGFSFAAREEFDALVTFDSDGQHRAKDVGRLVGPILGGWADVVVGSRLLGQSSGMPRLRRFLNVAINVLTLFLFGYWSTDSQSGLRAFNKKAVDSIRLVTDRMEVSSEFFREIRRNKLHYTEVPIEPIYTSYSLASGQTNADGLAIAFKMFLRLFR